MANRVDGRKVVLYLVLPIILIILSWVAFNLWASPEPFRMSSPVLFGREFGSVLLVALSGGGLYIAYRADLPISQVNRDAFLIGALFVGAVALTLLVPGSYQAPGWLVLLAAMESVALLALLLRVRRHVQRGPKLLMIGLWLLASANGVDAAIKLL